MAKRSSSDLDEYAHLDEDEGIPLNQIHMLPQFSDAPKRPYAKIQRPGIFEGGADVDMQNYKVLGGGRVKGMPPGFSVGDDGIIRDPLGDPAEIVMPPRGQIISDIANMMQPGGPAGAAIKAVSGGAHAGSATLGVGPKLKLKDIGTAKMGPAPPEPGKRMGHNGGPVLTDQGTKAPYPQYAERYPEVGPPVKEIDKKTGKEFDKKQLTPEALAFQKERAKIMRDMEQNGFEPYFDPAKRHYADPSHYPPNQNTIEITPKKQATIDNDMKTIGSKDARKRLQDAYARGKEMPETQDWYAVGQLEDAFIKELGPVEGRKAFADRFATSMAATTGGADPTSNLLMAQYGNYLRANDLPYPAASHEMPFPIGGRYVTSNMEQHKKIFDAGGWTALGQLGANPKRHNFAQNFMGNRNVATMDEQMTGGMVPGLQMPPPGKYGLFEGVLHQEAAKAGVPPANFQDVGWAGFKSEKTPGYTQGQPMIGDVNEAIERTHRLTGMPKDEIVRRGFVKGEIPLYSLGARPPAEEDR